MRHFDPHVLEPDIHREARMELQGARRMVAHVLIAESAAFVAQWRDLKLPGLESEQCFESF
jgi:hypothetical protein